MNNLAPITEPDKIAAAIMASDALGLAGSSAMTGYLRVSYARELVLRIDSARATVAKIDERLRAVQRDMTPAEDAQWSAAEDEESDCRNRLKTLVSEQLGVCPEDLVNAL